jgi:hypothetical protein
MIIAVEVEVLSDGSRAWNVRVSDPEEETAVVFHCTGQTSAGKFHDELRHLCDRYTSD